MAAQLRFAARDSWDEVVSACLRPSPTLAVEDCSAWGRSGRRALHPFDDPGVLLLELRRAEGGWSRAAAVSEAFAHLESKATLAAFLEANSLTDMAPRTVAVAFHADCPVPRPPWALPWVLKRDGTSGGTEVHFVTDPAEVDGWVEAEQELAEQLPFQSVRLSRLGPSFSCWPSYLRPGSAH